MKKVIIFICVAVLPFPILAQITFERLYEFFSTDNEGFSVVQNIDNGYIIAGSSGEITSQKKILLFRTDEIGDTIWVHRIASQSGGAEAFSVLLANDCTIVTCGRLNNDLFILKADQEGQVVFLQEIGIIPEIEIGKSIKQTNDYGYIICGYSFDTLNWDIELVRTDTYGDTIWTRYIGDPIKCEIGNDVVQTMDSGFLVAGYSYFDSIWPAFNKVLLLKTDANGNLQWLKRLGSDSDENEAVSVVLNNDQGFTIAGMTGNEILLMRFDRYGDTVWRKSLLPPGWTYAYAESIRLMPDQGYVLTGTGILGVFLMRTDSSGNMIWCRDFPQPWTHGFEVSLTSDSGFIITGSSDLSTYKEVYLVKTDENGIITGETEIPVNELKAPWPNPCHETVTILVKEDPVTISVINSIGQPVPVKYQKSGHRVQIQMSELPPGLYSVIIITNRGKNHFKILHL